VVTRVKICGLTRREDAELAIEYGAHALGFIFQPNSKRFLPEVPSWIAKLPPYVSRVAVYGNAPVAFTEEAFHAIQGVADSFSSAWSDSRQRIGAVRVRADDTVESVLAQAEGCDAVLLDAYQEGVYGGTGHVIDWSFAAAVVKASAIPVVLAGGLTPENVAEAISVVRPYAVDVCSGVEAEPGVKEAGKLKAFLEAALNS
jgi:phosphoribosylanthranilate isomerase